MDDEVENNNVVMCSICLGPDKWPKARPKGCEHKFCHLCISEWVKRRSECPLCKRQINALVIITQDGEEGEESVKRRTAAQYEREIIFDEELRNQFYDGEDISITYARCQVCSLSENDHLLLLCDGVVGHNLDGSSIRCNAACHCYCLPEKLERVPDEDWFCPYCVDLRATQESVYNTRYAQRRLIESSNRQRLMMNEDEPGPSGINRNILRTRRGSYVVVFNNSESSTESSSESSSNNSSEEAMQNNPNNLLHLESSTDSGVWDNQDRVVLATGSDAGYNPVGMTEVTPRRKRVHRKKIKKNSKNAKKRKIRRKRTEKNCATAGKIIKKRKRKKKHIRKRKVTAAQRRLADAIGLDLLTGRQKKRDKSERFFPPDGIRRGPFGAPLLSIKGGEDLDMPVENPSPEPKEEEPNDEAFKEMLVEKTDLIATIMFEQTKTLAPSRYQRILRDGTIGETEQMIQHRKIVEEKIATCKELTLSGDLKEANENTPMHSVSNNDIDIKEKRKKRPSRWGTPTTSKSHDSTILTASIPLPVGPPLTQPAVSLENIPIPSTNQQPSLSQVTLPSRPSALNTAPSTSFALNAPASVSSFGMANGQPPQINLAPFTGSGLGQQPLGLNQQSLVTLGQQQLTNLGQQTLTSLGQQPVPGLSQTQLTPIGQASLVQMQPSLLPNFFLPPLNLGSMNGLLAAGLLANNNPLATPPITQPLPQPSSATTTPFMLNPVQLSAASAQQLNQHLVNFATNLQQRSTDTTAAVSTPQLSQQALKLPEAVPPPPPVMKPPEPTSNNISLCEPLAEKIRKLIEASNVRPLCDSNVEEGVVTKIAPTIEERINDEVLCSGELKVGESGRKSASADDEETGEAAIKIRRVHKNGAMFEEARRMLSTSLKKVYRLKQITKQEYKEIMKKGVTALSQRTKLDQRKVDDYATKYVECVVHRRKKRH